MSQGKAVEKVAVRQRQAARRRQAAARRRIFSRKPAAALQRKINRGERRLAELQASDPRRYFERRREADDKKIGGVNVEKAGRAVNEGIYKGAEFAKKHLRTAGPGNAPGLSRGASQAGYAGEGAREVLDLVANAPTSAYETGAALNAARKGNKKPVKRLWKDFKDTSALAAAASGDWQEAADRAEDRPVTTALELSGAKAVLGRTTGAALRRAPVPGPKGFRAKVRSVGSTERPNLKLYEGRKGPEIQRQYSRDSINKAAQKYAERRVRKGSRVRKDGTQRRPGRDPHTDRGSYLVPASPLAKGGQAGTPNPHRLKRRIDTRVFSQARVMEQRRRRAQRDASKAQKRGDAKKYEDIARADLVRHELRERAKEVSPTERKHIRELINLPDERLIDMVEASARERMGERGERAFQGLTPEEAAVAARALERRAQKGKPLTAGQAAAITGAVGKQIERDVRRRKEGGELPNAGVVRGIAAAIERPASAAFKPHGKPIRFKSHLDGKRHTAHTPGRGALDREGRLHTWFEDEGTHADRGFDNLDAGPSERFPQRGSELFLIRPDGTISIHGGTGRMSDQEIVARAILQDRRLLPPKDWDTSPDAPGPMDTAGKEHPNFYQTLQQARAALSPDRRSAKRPDRPEPLRASDFGDYFAGLQRRQATPAPRILPSQQDVNLARMRPEAKDVPRLAGQRALYNTGLQHQRLLAEEFGVRVGKKGFRKTRDGVKQWIDTRKIPGDLVPFQRAKDEWVAVPRSVAARLQEHKGVDESIFGPGSGLDRATNVFKDVVLTTSSPARWIGGNVADIGMRTLFAGITPLDIARGAGIAKRLGKEGLQGEQAAAALTGGGLYTAAEALTPASRAAKYNIPRHVWRAWKQGIYTLEHSIEVLPQYGAIGKAMRQESGRRIKAPGPHPTNVWTDGPVFQFHQPWDPEHGIHAPMGKHAEWAAGDFHMKTNLKTLLKLHDQQMESYAKNLATDRAMEARIQKATEDVIGRWGKVSPTMRRSLSVAPFAQWLGAATRYTFVTLPVHHPIKTAILAGITEMTEDERIKLGLSYFAPEADQAPDYQMGMLPTDVSHNKYGPVVEGYRTSRMTSLGTAAGAPWNLPEFLLPQIASGFNALRGQSFTGEPLVYPPQAGPEKEGLPMSMVDRLPVAVGAQAESMVPFASAFRRTVLEKGRPSEPHSTILTPETRPKFDYKKREYKERPADSFDGLKEWVLPFAPKSRIYSLGAARDIERSQATLKTLEKWQKRQKAKREREQQYGPTTPNPSDDFWGEDQPKPKAQKKAPSNDFWK